MDGDIIGLFALLVGLELILGVDNVLVIAILVSRLPEEKRNLSRNFGLTLAMVARIVMIIGGLKLIELTEPAWPNGPTWFAYSTRELALMAGGLFLIWKAVKEIHSTMELEEENAPSGIGAGFGYAITQIVLLDIVFSLDSVINRGWTHKQSNRHNCGRRSFLRCNTFLRQTDWRVHTSQRLDQDIGFGLSHRDRDHNLYGRHGQARGQKTHLHAYGVCHGYSIPATATQ